MRSLEAILSVIQSRQRLKVGIGMCVYTEENREKEISFDLNIGDYFGYGKQVSGVKNRMEKNSEDIIAVVQRMMTVA